MERLRCMTCRWSRRKNQEQARRSRYRPTPLFVPLSLRFSQVPEEHCELCLHLDRFALHFIWMIFERFCPPHDWIEQYSRAHDPLDFGDVSLLIDMGIDHYIAGDA